MKKKPWWATILCLLCMMGVIGVSKAKVKANLDLTPWVKIGDATWQAYFTDAYGLTEVTLMTGGESPKFHLKRKCATKSTSLLTNEEAIWPVRSPVGVRVTCDGKRTVWIIPEITKTILIKGAPQGVQVRLKLLSLGAGPPPPWR